MNEQALSDGWFEIRKEAIRALVLFAESYIVLTWEWDPRRYFKADTPLTYIYSASPARSAGRKPAESSLDSQCRM